MGVLFLEGFDKYGGANTNTTVLAALMAGEWNTITSPQIAAPLSSAGQACLITNNASLTKSLSSAIGHVVGGIRINPNLAGTVGLNFLDGATAQCSISIATTGTITFRNGSYTSGTVLGTASTPLVANATHYLEWDIVFGTSSAYTIYLDGNSIISGTGNTITTANHTISAFALLAAAGSGSWTLDDLYVFDTTGSTNNAVLLTSPRVETAFPISDSSVQFTVGASILGTSNSRVAAGFSTGANLFYLRSFKPSANCTLNDISFTPNVTNGTVNFRPVVYSSDINSNPSSLLTTGANVTGCTSGTNITMPLTTPQTLTAGALYWLGLMCDTALTAGFLQADSNNSGRSATATFTSGAPGTAPTTSATNTILLWGNITLTSPTNTYEVSASPPPAGDTSYVTDSTAGNEDVYNLTNSTAATVYAVSVKALGERSDSGSRTVSMHLNSGGTDSAGTSVTPATTYSWMNAYYNLDPNGSIAWTTANLNLTTSGFKVDS